MSEKEQGTAPVMPSLEEYIGALDRETPFDNKDSLSEKIPREEIEQRMVDDIVNLAIFTQDPEIVGRIFGKLFEVSEEDKYYAHTVIYIIEKLINNTSLFANPEIAEESIRNIAGKSEKNRREKEMYLFKMLHAIERKSSNIGEFTNKILAEWIDTQAYLEEEESTATDIILSTFVLNSDYWEDKKQSVEIIRKIKEFYKEVESCVGEKELEGTSLKSLLDLISR